MNYFSHFWVDGKEDNHYYNTGLILPDFARKHVKTFLNAPAGMQHNFQLLHQGCLMHYQADKAFHTSAFFANLLQQSNYIINNAAFSKSVQRKWFLAHILVELMLDRLLVKNNKSALDAFYKSLNSVSEEDLTAFLTLFNGTEIDAFMQHFIHFSSVQYIYFYADNIKFVYSLNRIMMRAGVGELSILDQEVLLQVVLTLEQDLSPQVPALLHQLKQSVHG